jgi:pimeloyl-ACP methyl ester carboxylesterase
LGGGVGGEPTRGRFGLVSVIPAAKLSIYDGIGHSPFYEDAARFNRELAAFVRMANEAN